MAEADAQYEMHLELIRNFHAGRKSFDGRRTFQCLASLSALCRAVTAGSFLDYGCGKGEQWKSEVPLADAGRPGVSLQDYLGLTSVHLYDPGVPEYEAKPTELHDPDVVAVVDVLEYVPLINLRQVITEIFAYTGRCVYFNLTCNQPRKPCQLDTEWGRSPFFWLGRVLAVARHKPSVGWFVRMETGAPGSQRELVAGVGDTVAFTGAGQFSVDDVRRVLSRVQPA